MRLISRASVPARALVCMLALALLACGARVVPATLPAEPELEPDRLVILLHGYVSESGAITPLFDLLNREGVPRAWAEPGRSGKAFYHTHSFDFSRFTRVGSDHNVGVGDLGAAFSHFYHALPQSCPICAHRAEAPVEVTLVARSFGGIVAREFLLNEAEQGSGSAAEVPGDLERHSHWKISRVVSLATPFYGSFKTLFSTGFLSIIINGLVRTVVWGFVRPEQGGVFGNVIDAQARALRYGSIFLWRQHIRWELLLRRMKAEGREPPPWLAMAAVGNPDPARDGDGTTRFPSANIAPQFVDQHIETFVADLRHGQFFRSEERGRKARELTRTSRALVRFMEHGTLANDPSHGEVPWGVVTDGGKRRVTALAPSGEPADGSGLPVEQTLYFQPKLSGEAADPDAVSDLNRKLRRLDELFSADLGDVWLRFYDELPDEDEPQVLRLRRAISLFRNGIEHSRSWADLISETELDASGAQIPVVQAMAPMSSHLITIPDVTPTGPYQLGMTLDVPHRARAMPIPPSAVRVVVEGKGRALPATPGSIPLYIEPHRVNLVHVYLDGAALRALYPEVRELDLAEVWLQPTPLAPSFVQESL